MGGAARWPHNERQMWSWILLFPLGLVAGVLTTLAGLGGGMLTIIALSLAFGPHVALAITAPALLLGNAHRFWLHRRHVDVPLTRALVYGAVPGAIAGGLVAVRIPVWLIDGMLAAVTLLAVLRSLGVAKWTPPRRAYPPYGILVGWVNATSGGAGILLSPALLAAGLSGEIYIGTTSAIATFMHAGRLLAYGVQGMVTRETLARSGVILAALIVGNLLGDRFRPRFSAEGRRKLELSTLVVCVVLAIAGLRG
jgi:uncharacterized protein